MSGAGNPNYALNGAGTAASGGKGGTMGGFDPATATIASADAPANPGKGGEKNPVEGGVGPMAPAHTDMQVPLTGQDMTSSLTAGQAQQGPNAFEQGLAAQNAGMDFYRNAMNGNQGIMDMIGKLGEPISAPTFGGGGGGGGGVGSYSLPQVSAPGKDLYNYNPAQVQSQGYQAAQLSDADINQYMNPYTQNVIDNTMADLGRARDSAMNSTGAAATRGGAFGGDRHAIMEAQNNADYMRQAATTSANLRNQGFQNAQNAAMSDINALNQQRGVNSQAENAARMANAQARNARDQFVGSLASQNDMAAQQANLQAATSMGVAGQSAAASMHNARSAADASKYNAMLAQRGQNDRAALSAAMAQQGMQFDAANMLYGMGQDRWGMGQDATNSLANVGQQVDGINQNLIDSIRQQWESQTGAPQSQFNQYLSALAGAPGNGGQTQSYSPGKMDFLGMGTQLGAAALMGSDVRLKENIQKVATVNGINLYSWDWNEDGEANFPGQKPFGVLAQEIAETRPDAVVENADGWLMVDYGKLPEIRPAVMGAQYV